MTEEYYYYESYASRDVKITLNDDTIVQGYLDVVIPSDEIDDNQVLLAIKLDNKGNYRDILAGEIKKIEEI